MGSGEKRYVESKFGKSTLTKPQREAQKALGDQYYVERWGYDFFDRIGSYLGGGVGYLFDVNSMPSDCDCN